MEDLIFKLRTPLGEVIIGHRMADENSNILCLVCLQKGVPYGCKNKKEFKNHLKTEHKELLDFLIISKKIEESNQTKKIII